MSLQELLRRCRAHLRRYHTQEIILHTQDIYGCKLSLFHYYLQGSRELLVLLAFPMEVHSYGDSMKDKGRLCELGGKGPGFKVQFIIQDAVVFNLSFSQDCLAWACPIGKYFEFYFLCGHYAHLQGRLSPCQAPYQAFLLVLRH